MTHITSIFDFTKSSSATKTILWSGFIAGNLDAIAGAVVYFIFFGMNPIQVVQFIGSGIHGPTAIGGGLSMFIAGLLYHFLISYVLASIYFFAYVKIKILRDYKIVMGLIFGLGIWLIMNLIILPQSNIPKSPFDVNLAIVGIIWHMALVGLPIALITSLYFDKKA